MYQPVSLKYSSRALATARTAEAWPQPIPFCSRVMQMEPPPIPILMKSAPQSEELEAFCVYNVAGTDDGIRIVFLAPLECSFLPYGETVG